MVLRYLTFFVRWFMIGCLGSMVIGGAMVAGMLFYMMNHNCIDLSMLDRYRTDRPSVLLDDEGHEWARFQLDRKEPVPFARMPKQVIQAFVAAEDWDFFKHQGLSWKGMFRSLCVNVYHGRIVQGASTITQQLTRALFFDTQRTFKRKVKEQWYALLLERHLSKEQILEAYLNNIYFGRGIYGVQAASQRFWAKSVSELTVDEAATLAAIVRSPERYCPLVYPLSAQRVRNAVLANMRKLKFIDESSYRDAIKMSVQTVYAESGLDAPYIKEAIRVFCEKQFGRELLYSGGLTIQTTINRQLQERANEVFKRQCTKLREQMHMPIDGGLITMHGPTGQIKALVGGYDFATSQYNRALHAKRQVGSTFKLIVYAAALQSGASFADTDIDEPLTMSVGNKEWAPHNYTHDFEGQMTLAYALSHSNNIVAVKTFLRTGVAPIVALAKKCHLSGTLNPYPSLALGCVEASIQEGVGFFNVFAQHGWYVEPHLIANVKDRWQTTIWRAHPVKEAILNPRISDQVAHVLGLGFARIRRMNLPEELPTSQAIGKTGTTNDSRTCWFMGATPSYTTAVYIGCDDNREMGKDVYPIRTAFPIWQAVHSKVPDQVMHFEWDHSLKAVYVHEKTGAISDNTESNGVIPILV